jgi:hypothetical protein
MPPEDFEREKQGDCEDFALWMWRQLLEMGYESRFVVGHGNRNARGHAWLTFRQGDDDYVLEPLAGYVGTLFPQFHILFLPPTMSVKWDGSTLRYFQHEDLRYVPRAGQLIRLLVEGCGFWIRIWARFIPRAIWRTARSPVGVARQFQDIAKRLTRAFKSPIIVFKKRFRGRRRK